MRVKTGKSSARTVTGFQNSVARLGITTILGGRPSPRGPETFLAASSLRSPPSEVVELVFRNVAALPDLWEVGTSPDGPWYPHRRSGYVPSNSAMAPSASPQT